MNERNLVDIISERVIERLQCVCFESEKKTGAIPVGISVRHVHITKDDFKKLFGSDRELTRRNDLIQKGQFAAKETVSVIGPRLRPVHDVRILGPFREYTQVELSKTDCIILGIDPPVRDSGDLEDTPGAILVGPKGSVNLEKGVIRASRHIHINEDEARTMGVKDREFVKVKLGGERGLIFDKVRVNVRGDFSLELHLDTDDGNAADVRCNDYAVIVKE